MIGKSSMRACLAGCAYGVLAIAALGAPAYAHAQDAAPAADRGGADAADDIIVTARKRDESLRDVPVAIQVMNAESLQRYGTVSITQVADMATQVQIYPTSAGSGGVFSVRGISSSNLDPGVDTSVAINIDGMGISRGRVIREAMFDVQTVEVLKGPQALFFGKNSPAGVITIRSADPTPDWQFKARAFYEFEAREKIGELIASGPISDTLGIRLAYQFGDSRGWARNNAQPRAPTLADPVTLPGALDHWLGGYTQHLGRLTLVYDPGDKLKVRFKVSGASYRGDATAALNEVVGCSGAYPIAGANVDLGGDCKVNGVVSAGALPLEFMGHYRGLEGRQDTRGYNKYNSVISTLEINYDFGNINLTSQTGLHHYNSKQLDSFDATTFAINSGYQTEKSTTWSQELRLLSTFDSPINFMIGGYYEHFSRNFTGNGTLFRAKDPVTGRWDQWETVTDARGYTLSAFGQLVWNFADQFELSAGARYTYESKSEIGRTLYASVAVLNAGVIAPTFSDNNVSPEVTLRWKPNADLMFYGAYKTGYKSGGFSGQTYFTIFDTAAGLTFKEETARGFEVGFKGTFDNDRLRLNLTAYRYDFEGIQDTVFDAAAFRAAIFNADARVQGFEFEANYRPIPELQLRAQGGYNDAKYREFRNAPCFSGQTVAEGCVANTTGLGGPAMVQDISGRRRPFAPEWTFGVGHTADIPLGNYVLSVSQDVNYMSGYLTQVPNTPGSAQKAVFRWDASVRFGPSDERWSLALIGRNLTNQYYVGATTDKPGGVRGDIYGQVIRARQIALEATARF